MVDLSVKGEIRFKIDFVSVVVMSLFEWTLCLWRRPCWRPASWVCTVCRCDWNRSETIESRRKTCERGPFPLARDRVVLHLPSVFLFLQVRICSKSTAPGSGLVPLSVVVRNVKPTIQRENKFCVIQTRTVFVSLNSVQPWRGCEFMATY